MRSVRHIQSLVNGNRKPQLDEPKLERDISECADVINFILARAGCPVEHRAYIDAVVGASGGLIGWFEACDLLIGKRMLGTEAEEKSKIAIKKRVQRARKEFNDWQESSGYVFIECEPGGQTREGERYDSRYRVPLLKAAAEALQESRQRSERGESFKRAVQAASRTAVKKLRGPLFKRDRFNRPRQTDEAVLNRSRKTAITHATKIRDIIRRNGKDPEKFLKDLADDIASLATLETDEAIANPVDGFVHTYVPYGQSCPQGDVEAQKHGPGGSHKALESIDSAAEAEGMILAFESVGARLFGVTTIGENGLEKYKQLSASALKCGLEKRLAFCERKQESLIVRPFVRNELRLVQLDDLDRDGVEQVQGFAFLVIETSPENYQAWLAVEGCDKQAGQRLKRGLGADDTASGATRLAGSRNFKAEHAPHYPMVRVVHVEPGLIVPLADIEDYLAPEEAPPARASYASTPRGQTRSKEPRAWPSYDVSWNAVLAKGDLSRKHKGQPDRDKVDFNWCLHAIKWGWSVEMVASRLLEVSEKAKEKGTIYATKTARNAALVAGL
jgi:hypothetical protein